MSDRQGQNRISSSQGWITGRILLGYFLLAANIAVEKWLLESYSLLEINFVTAALFMTLTAFQELLTRGSLVRIKPVSWKVLCWISLFTLGAWHCFLSALSGLSVFEFGAMSLLSPVMMAVFWQWFFWGEKPSRKIWPAILLGMAGGWLMMQAEWEGWSSQDHQAFMLGALLFASLRWITVKFAGEKFQLAMIFWEPVLVLLLMGAVIDPFELWHNASLSSSVQQFCFSSPVSVLSVPTRIRSPKRLRFPPSSTPNSPGPCSSAIGSGAASNPWNGSVSDSSSSAVVGGNSGTQTKTETI